MHCSQPALQLSIAIAQKKLCAENPKCYQVRRLQVCGWRWQERLTPQPRPAQTAAPRARARFPQSRPPSRPRGPGRGLPSEPPPYRNQDICTGAPPRMAQSLPPTNGGPTVKSEGSLPSVKTDVDYELPDLPEAPVFYPTAEEFADPMKYLDSIREQAAPAGVIKIVPPKEWRCPFPIKENGDSFHFQTCVQSVDQLRHRHGPGTKFMQRLRHFHRTRGLHLPAEVRPARY